MARIDPNSSVYPTTMEPGLTIRQRFIMAAMQGLSATPNTFDSVEELAALAIIIADAQIAAINAEEPT